MPVRTILAHFRPFARPYRFWMVLVLILAAASPALDTAGLYLFRVLVDDVLTPRNFGRFPGLAAWYIALTVFSGILGFASSYLAVWVGERLLTDVRVHTYRHLHSLSLEFFERKKLGDTLSRLTGDVGAIEFLILNSLTSTLNMVLRILLFGGMLFWLNWKLASVSLLMGPILWGIGRLFAGPLRRASQEVRASVGAMSTIAEEGMSNVAVIQAYGRVPAEVDRFHQQNLRNLRNRLRATSIQAGFGPVTDLLELVGLLTIIGLGSWQLTRGEVTLGALLVFMAYFAQLVAPVRGLSGLFTSMSASAASAERVVELLQEEPHVKPPASPVPLPPSTGHVELKNVSFTYPTRDKPVLRDLSLDIEPGTTVAVTGESGQGKSTVMKLLLGFYAPSNGSVTVDGVSVTAADLDEVRSRYAVVLQETLLFDGSVRDNLMWAVPDATPEQLERAITDSDLSSVLARLPDGLDSQVGQRGRGLSGGERQRLAIARAMLRDAPIVILDEPTTGLDRETAQRVLEPLQRLAEGRTTIIISHDSAAIDLADRVVRIAGGVAVEQEPGGAEVVPLRHRVNG